MKTLWAHIGFKPSNFNNNESLDGDEMSANVNIKENNFTPPQKKNKLNEMEMDKFTGVVIRNFPKEIPETAITSFLEDKGLPMGWKDIKIIRKHKNSSVDIENLDAKVCKMIIEEINNRPFFDRKLYCNGMSNVTTPEKVIANDVEKQNNTLKEDSSKEQDPKKNEPNPIKNTIPGSIGC